METDNKKKFNRTIISVIFATVCFLVLGMLYMVLVRRDLASERERLSYMARNEAEHIVTTIDCVMARTNTLKALIQDHNGDTSFFNQVAMDIYDSVIEETGVTLKNFAVAPGCIVSDVYPLEGNEALVGFDFLDTRHTGNAEAKRAYEQGRTILTNPFELLQGGYGMGGRSPVILRYGDETELWGLVTVTIDFDNLMQVLRLDNLEGMGMNYALSYIDPEGGSHIMQAKGSLDDKAVRTQFEVRNLTWELAVTPRKGWISVWRVALSTALLLMISGFAGLFANIMLQLRDTNAILLQLSITDRLTGGLNRRAYEDALSELSEKPAAPDFVYISADLNGLKRVNDTLGHPAGDELINGAKECMQKAIEGHGELYRIGGDEFAALIYADESLLTEIIEKMESLVKEWKGKTVKELSLSIGYASIREFPEATVRTLIKKADERMYAAKKEYYDTAGIDRRRY
ncbi:MAG: sensor domain-containing diguanylate cyclase [Lachnospiraceae bacterium]|nr:sensor domain-containing diguanylate cyclase [Lachnospiraceae bacterium]